MPKGRYTIGKDQFKLQMYLLIKECDSYYIYVNAIVNIEYE